jgi:nucleotide-binding universal stress UspA family protein
MFKMILVPVDDSYCSKLAYAKAVELAKLINAEITLIQVFSTPDQYLRGDVMFGFSLTDEMKQNVSNSIIKDARKDVDEGNVKISELIVSGNPAQEIVKEANYNKYDLIVMGSRGNGPFKGAVVGSVSLRVLSGAECAVLTVKDPDADKVDSNTVVAWT